jgi:hypothetical protein
VEFGRGLLWAIRDPITRRDPKTGEGVVIDPGVSDKRLCVHETEFATILQMLQRGGLLRRSSTPSRTRDGAASVQFHSRPQPPYPRSLLNRELHF